MLQYCFTMMIFMILDGIEILNLWFQMICLPAYILCVLRLKGIMMRCRFLFARHLASAVQIYVFWSQLLPTRSMGIMPALTLRHHGLKRSVHGMLTRITRPNTGIMGCRPIIIIPTARAFATPHINAFFSIFDPGI